MSKEINLHPDIVDYIVEDLLGSDIISKDEVAKLKKDSFKIIDPTIVMDIRHKEVKNESLTEVIGERNYTSLQKRKIEDSIGKSGLKVKDLKTIDKEIANTRRDLEQFHNQLAKNNEVFTNEINNLEKKKENEINSSTTINFNEDEAKKYFNLHLDCLENERRVTTLKKNKIWKPYEIHPSPVINVFTSLKVINFKPASAKLNTEELEMMAVCKNSIHVVGNPVHCFTSQPSKLTELNIAPNNSPLLGETQTLAAIENNDCTFLNEKQIGLNVIKKWKKYAKIKIAHRITIEKEKDHRTYLLKQAFLKWNMYVKYCKTQRKSAFTSPLVNKSVSSTNKNCEISLKLSNNATNIKAQKKSIKPLVKINLANHAIKERSDVIEKRKTEPIYHKGLPLHDDTKPDQLDDSIKIQVQSITPEGVGLINKNNKTEIKQNYKAPNVKPQENKNSSISNEVHKRCLEMHKQLNCKLKSQEKVISQQFQIIEKQQKVISDLKVQQFETKSKLSLQIAENQLQHASTTFDKKLQPVIKNITADCNITSGKTKNPSVDMSETLTRNLFLRQEHCRQLAESTKMRRIKMENEQARMKAEQEEKIKHQHLEERRRQAVKVKNEQRIAYENEKKVFDTKQRITRLTEIAINHYNKILIKKVFNIFKNNFSLRLLKTKKCMEIYDRNLMKNTFKVWKSEAKASIILKCQSADNYYNLKIMQHCWNTWRRVRITNDITCKL